MAATNGYTPEQASDLYIADGTIIDWLWGEHKIFAYTFEMYPRPANPGFYPPDEVIARRRPATARPCCGFLEYADCLYRVIGKQAQYCGGPPPITVFSDNFETDARLDARPADTATTGRLGARRPGGHHLQRRRSSSARLSAAQRPGDRPLAGPTRATTTSTAA